MAKYSEVVYLVLDELKLISDDSHFTQEHVIFLCDKLRSYLLEKKYAAEKSDIPEINYQEICLDLEETPAIPGTMCSGVYLKSTVKIPATLSLGMRRVYTDYLSDFIINFVSLDRMAFVGSDKWSRNFIYAAIGPDRYLYLKSNNPLFLHLSKIKFRGIFANTEEASELQCEADSDSESCDILDKTFPLEESLVTPMIQYAVQELSGQRYMPADTTNNARDDMHGAMNPNSRNTYRRGNYENQSEGGEG